MIDCLSFVEHMTDKSIKLHSTKKLELDEITEKDYVLGHYQVAGFSLTEKRWCWFMVDNIDDIYFDENAFDTLLLPLGQKRLVQALTKQHVLGHDNFDDMIKNKGKGCIFLLHGPPGVGKTATVESIADAIKRPMYVMMSGDLGSDLKAVESNFSKVLKLVAKWKAILLIDEADVFLEKRSSHDLVRNSLVSSKPSIRVTPYDLLTRDSFLLRIFEYFSGIMFMTTNRVNSIDPAFQSRIHLTLAYNPLDDKSRKGLWRLFLERSADYDKKNWPNEVLGDLAKVQLNGRQIKNAVRTANSLALAEHHTLSVDDIRVVLDTVAEFETVFKPRPSPQPFNPQLAGLN
jgi:SpoVK/Ycf46/Vps4 family AAA+-type ATPase